MESMEKLSILVVIPTLNEARTIESVIARLSEDPPANCDLRFVIADGGSVDGTQDIVRKFAALQDNVVLLDNPHRLQSAGVNAAARTYGHDADILVRCDAHAVYPVGFIRSLLASYERTGADSVVVPMDSSGQSCLQRAVAWVSDTPIGSGGSSHRGGRQSGFVDHGHHALFRMESFQRVGGYDKSFSHNEDAEFDCRFRALGGKIWLDGETRLHYHPRSSFKRLWMQYFGYGKGRSRTVRRHPTSLRLRQFAVPSFLLLCCLSILLSWWVPLLLLIPGIYAAALTMTSVAIAAKKRSVCGLLGGPAALTMHASWAAGFFTGLLTLREPRWTQAAQQEGALRSAGELS